MGFKLVKINRFGFMTKIPFPVNFTVTVTEDLVKHQRGKIMEQVEQQRSGSKDTVFPQLVLSDYMVVDRHKLTVFYLKSFDMDSVQVGKAVFGK